MRWTWVVACLVVAGCAGCSGTEVEVPKEDALGEAPAETRVAVDAEAVDRYLGYQHARLEAARRAAKRWQEVKAQANRTGASQADKARAVSRIRARMEREEALARRSAGLSAAHLKEIDALAHQILVGQTVSANGETEDMLRALKTALSDPRLPASDRREVRAELEQVVDELERARSFAEARERFGDAAVDAVVARADELAHLRSALLETRALLR